MTEAAETKLMRQLLRMEERQLALESQIAELVKSLHHERFLQSKQRDRKAREAELNQALKKVIK